MMEKKGFQKQNLNREDHVKVDNAAKNARKGIGALAVLAAVGTAAVKYGPKVVKAIAKTATKV